MPGHPLGLILPTLADPPDTQASLTITALQAIVADLEGLVSVVGLSADGPLNMGGQEILGSAGIAFVDSVPSTLAVGKLYRSGSDLWYFGSLGAIQLIKNGTLNGSLLGGFTGDLTHLNAVYNYLNNEYTFSSLDPALSKVKASSFKLQGASHYILLQPDPALAADKTLTLFAPPASGTSVHGMDSSGNLEPVSSSFKVTNDTYLANVFGPGGSPAYTLNGSTGEVKGAIVTTAEAAARHGTRQVPIPMSFGFHIGGAVANGWAYGGAGIQPLWTLNGPASGDAVWFPLPAIPEGETVVSVTLDGNWSAGTYSVELINSGVAAVGGFPTVTFSPGTGVSLQTVTLNHAVTAFTAQTWYLRINAPAGSTATLYVLNAQTTR